MSQEARQLIVDNGLGPKNRWDRNVEAAVDFMLEELKRAKRTAVVMACLFGATFVAGILTAVWLW